MQKSKPKEKTLEQKVYDAIDAVINETGASASFLKTLAQGAPFQDLKTGKTTNRFPIRNFLKTAVVPAKTGAEDAAHYAPNPKADPLLNFSQRIAQPTVNIFTSLSNRREFLKESLEPDNNPRMRYLHDFIDYLIRDSKRTRNFFDNSGKTIYTRNVEDLDMTKPRPIQ